MSSTYEKVVLGSQTTKVKQAVYLVPYLTAPYYNGSRFTFPAKKKRKRSAVAEVVAEVEGNEMEMSVEEVEAEHDRLVDWRQSR
jgi:hypothetical protein